MAGGLNFASLLGGIASEAAQIHTERQQQENQNFLQSQSIMQNLINDPNVPSQTKAQAHQAILDMTMEHLGYNKKAKSNNPVRKAVDGLVGQQPSDFSQISQVGQQPPAQAGVGSGNSKTALGGIGPVGPQGPGGGGPPTPDQGLGGNAMAAPPDAQNSPPTPPQTTPWLTPEMGAINPFQYTSEQATAKAAYNQHQLDRVKNISDMTDKADLFNARAGLAPLTPEMQSMGVTVDPYLKDLKDKNPEAFALERSRALYNMVTPVSYLKQAESKDDIPIEQAYAAHPELKDNLDALHLAPGSYVRPRVGIGGGVSSFDVGSTPPPISTPNVQDPSSPSGQSTIFSTRANPGVATNSVPTMPNFANSTQTISGTDTGVVTLPDNSTVTFDKPFTSTRGPANKMITGPPNKPSITGSTATSNYDPTKPLSKNNLPPGARLIGGKGISPEDAATTNNQRGQLLQLVGRADNVLHNLPMLNSLLNSGKMVLAADTDSGVISAVVGRNITLTPQESKFLSDFQSMTEDINTLRGPLGATGFRSAEAFRALQAQKGSLLARPDITAGVLKNTLQSALQQIGGHTLALNDFPKYQFPDSEKQNIVKAYLDAYNGDTATVKQKMKEHGLQ